MSENRASSGVRNLRAMFENQTAAASPEPPRGRSPASIPNTDSTRPTDKVRASFVSVEPSGHISRDQATNKGTVHGVNSTQARRRESFSVSEGHADAALLEIKKEVTQNKEAQESSDASAETISEQAAILEQAVESREGSQAPPPIREVEEPMPNLGSIMKGSDFPEPGAAEEKQQQPEVQQQEPIADNLEDQLAALSIKETPADNPDKVVTGAQENASLKPADPTDEAAVSGGEALPPPTEDLSSNSASEATSGAAAEQMKAVDKDTSKAKVDEVSNTPAKAGTSSVKKPAAISTATAAPAKASSAKNPMPKSPAAARLPKTPTTPKAATSAKEQPKRAASKEPAKAPTQKTSRGPLGASVAAPTTSAAAKSRVPAAEPKKPVTKPATAAPTAPKERTATSPAGFKKPKPKSPTRPVRLPSHLVAPTAASAAKHGDDANQKIARKPSTASRPAATRALAPKAPAVGKPSSRHSLAPSTAAGKRPESRASTKGAADEGFLARMMRPTAASASKTQDKPASPPRKAASGKPLAKSKPGNESVLAKGKTKVSEVASKAKELVTNGHTEDKSNDESAPASDMPTTSEKSAPSDVTTAGTSEAIDEASEPERQATPTEQVDESSAAEPQTPNFEGQAIR
jgi:hypothetical protein